jgi:hypothetical protein
MREEILIKNYETGTIDFKRCSDIQELQLNLDEPDRVCSNLIYAVTINYLINPQISNYEKQVKITTLY